MTKSNSLNDVKYQSYVDVGTQKTAQRVTDTTVATNKLSISGESVTFAAGVAGTTGVVTLDKAPVFNNDGGKVGEKGDTSFAWVTGTILTTEVSFKTWQTDTVQLTELAQGEYAIDYDLGRILYCKKTNGGSDTCNYTSRQLNVELTGATDIEIGAVELKNGADDTRGIIKAANTFATTDVALGVADANVLAAIAVTNAAVHAEDDAFVDADKGVAILSKRTDTAATSAGTDGDYATVNTDSTGRLWVNTELPDAAALADATANPTVPAVGSFSSSYNGTTWDRNKSGLYGAQSAVVGYQNIINVGRYNSTPIVLTDGQWINIQLDSAGSLKETMSTLLAGEDLSNNIIATCNRKLASATYSPLLFQNLGANATLNVKASAGNVFSVKCHNLNASSRYIQIHNTATTPGGAAVPAWVGLVPANTEVIFGEDCFSQAGLNFTTGIAFAFSTTEATYTAGTAGDQVTHINYI